MSFFKSVALKKDTDEQFRNTLKQVFYGSMDGLKLSNAVKIKLENEAFIDLVLKEDPRGLIDYVSEYPEEGHAPAAIGAAYLVCRALATDFQKLFGFIKDEKENSGFIRALMVFNEDRILTRPSQITPNTHAEIKILNFLEAKLRSDNAYKNYIGIAKLACLNCHAIIYGLNNGAYNNYIEIRGAHNLYYPNNWNPPFGITGLPLKLKAPHSQKAGITTRSNKIPDMFCNDLIKGYNMAIALAKSDSHYGSNKETMYPDYSELTASDGEDIDDSFNKHKIIIDNDIDKIKCILKYNDLINVKKYDELLFIQKLYTSNRFKVLWEADKLPSDYDVEQAFFFISEEINQPIDLESGDICVLLTNPIYVGFKIAKIIGSWLETKLNNEGEIENNLVADEFMVTDEISIEKLKSNENFLKNQKQN
jgi:hypothetical protein